MCVCFGNWRSGGIWGINVQENLGYNFYKLHFFFTAIQSGHDIKLEELLILAELLNSGL